MCIITFSQRFCLFAVRVDRKGAEQQDITGGSRVPSAEVCAIAHGTGCQSLGWKLCSRRQAIPQSITVLLLQP